MPPVPPTFLVSETDLAAALRKLGGDWNMDDLKASIAATICNGNIGDYFSLSDDVFGILRECGRPGERNIEVVLLIRPDTDGTGKKTVISTL